MDARIKQLVLLSAVAIYVKKGVIEAIKYLVINGMSHDEAVDWLSLYDGYVYLAEHDSAFGSRKTHLPDQKP